MVAKKTQSKKGRPKKQRKEGFQFTKKITKEVVSEILDIREAEGLTSENVFKRAKKKSSSLHDFFDWNKDSAAYKYNLIQAGQLINEVQIVIEGELFSGFENVRVKVGKEYKRQYEPITEILNQDDLREQILKQALTMLESWKAKYEAYAELKPVILKIDEVSARLNNKWQKPKQKPKSKSKRR